VEPVDKNSLDRVPTRGERWVGVILTGLLALVFLPSAAFVLTKLAGAGSERRGLVIFAAVLAAIGVIGVFLFYRIAFTRPQAASIRAHRIYAIVAVVVTGLMVVGAFLLPANPTQETTSLSLFFGSLGVLASTHKGASRTQERKPHTRAL
jgi:hypothetical protein